VINATAMSRAPDRVTTVPTELLFLLPTSEVEEEASRLGDDPHEQEQAGQPLNSGRVSGAVKVQEINQRQYK
jgi:hypothetical protein